MKPKSRYITISSILFGYILLQFIWWQILLVKQNDKIITEKQKLIELMSTNEVQLKLDLNALHLKKKMQTVMIVSEGTVFLLLLLFGIYRIKLAYDKEAFLNSQQKNFFLSITHELKTPIAATKLQLQTLQKQQLDPAIQQELIANALLETERLNMLIDNVLFASRLETGEFITQKEKQNLGVFVESVLKRYYKNELAKGELNYHCTSEIYQEIDVNAFPSVIINLVDNALKYSTIEKEINVELENKNGSTLLRVSDKGCGINNLDKTKVFNKFFRAGNEETRNTKGTGLGLYIVQDLLNKHQASIKIKNNQPKGSVFEIEFYAI
jgi:K+-sensing histidine kinase KdpD